MSKFLTELPWHLEIDDNDLEAAMWQVENDFHCEFNDEICTKFDVMFGSSDEREPKFCPYHYFKMNMLGNDSNTSYKLVINK